MNCPQMTSKERILAAMAGRQPDRVPVQLGITNMFSIYRQGFIGWDVYAHQKAPLWKITADTQRQLGLDGYLYLRPTEIKRDHEVNVQTELVQAGEDRLVRRTLVRTPAGDLHAEETIFRNESPSVTEGLVKSEQDFQIWLDYCVRDDTDYDLASLREPLAYMGEAGTCAASTSIPGLHELASLFDGRLATATYFVTDHPEYLDIYRNKMERRLLRYVEQVIDSGVDYLEMSGSGMLTLATPDLFRQLSLPFIQKAAAICHQASVLTEVHCCGKARLVVEDLYRETAVDSVNPLQPPPMGDCDLAELKKCFGDRLCLKGNVGVTNPLLFGTPDDVEKDVLRCLDAAKAGGRFILFSEEGIGALTPVKNVERYVAVARAAGGY